MLSIYRHTLALLLISLHTLQAAPLTLDEAIQLLEQENLEIKISKMDEQNAKNDVKIAQGYHYGSLNLSQSAIRTDDALNSFGFKMNSREASFKDFGLSEFSTTNPNILAVEPRDLNYPGYHNLFQTKLAYTLPLYTGGKLSNYKEIASNMEKIKQLDTANVKAEKIYQLQKSYYDMALLEHSIAQLRIIHHNMTNLQAKTEKMLKEGYAKKIDLMEINAKRANVNRMIEELKGNQTVLYRYISFLLNTEVSEIVLPKTEKARIKATDADTYRNNDLAKASHALEIQSKMIDVASAPFLPTVGVFAEASSADNTFLGDFKDHAAYTVGGQLTWNLYNGGIDSHSLEKAKVERLKASSQLDLAKKGFSLQVERLLTEIKNFDFQIESLDKELEYSSEITKNYTGRYQEQLIPISDVLIKQSEEIEKILELQKVKNQRNERVFSLNKLYNGAEQ